MRKPLVSILLLFTNVNIIFLNYTTGYIHTTVSSGKTSVENGKIVCNGYPCSSTAVQCIVEKHTVNQLTHVLTTSRCYDHQGNTIFEKFDTNENPHPSKVVNSTTAATSSGNIRSCTKCYIAPIRKKLLLKIDDNETAVKYGKIKCYGNYCPDNTVQCIITNHTTDNLAYMMTSSRCYDIKGNILLDKNVTADNPTPGQLVNNSHSLTNTGITQDCSNCFIKPPNKKSGMVTNKTEQPYGAKLQSHIETNNENVEISPAPGKRAYPVYGIKYQPRKLIQSTNVKKTPASKKISYPVHGIIHQPRTMAKSINVMNSPIPAKITYPVNVIPHQPRKSVKTPYPAYGIKPQQRTPTPMVKPKVPKISKQQLPRPDTSNTAKVLQRVSRPAQEQVVVGSGSGETIVTNGKILCSGFPCPVGTDECVVTKHTINNLTSIQTTSNCYDNLGNVILQKSFTSKNPHPGKSVNSSTSVTSNGSARACTKCDLTPKRKVKIHNNTNNGSNHNNIPIISNMSVKISTNVTNNQHSSTITNEHISLPNKLKNSEPVEHIQPPHENSDELSESAKQQKHVEDHIPKGSANGATNVTNGKIICTGFICPPNTAECIVSKHTIDDLAYVKTTGVCYDNQGNIIFQQYFTDDNPNPSKSVNLTTSITSAGIVNYCTNCFIKPNNYIKPQDISRKYQDISRKYTPISHGVTPQRKTNNPTKSYKHKTSYSHNPSTQSNDRSIYNTNIHMKYSSYNLNQHLEPDTKYYDFLLPQDKNKEHSYSINNNNHIAYGPTKDAHSSQSSSSVSKSSDEPYNLQKLNILNSEINELDDLVDSSKKYLLNSLHNRLLKINNQLNINKSLYRGQLKDMESKQLRNKIAQSKNIEPFRKKKQQLLSTQHLVHTKIINQTIQHKQNIQQQRQNIMSRTKHFKVLINSQQKESKKKKISQHIKNNNEKLGQITLKENAFMQRQQQKIISNIQRTQQKLKRYLQNIQTQLGSSSLRARHIRDMNEAKQILMRAKIREANSTKMLHQLQNNKNIGSNVQNSITSMSKNIASKSTARWEASQSMKSSRYFYRYELPYFQQ